jgi:hypothetical protein
MAELTELEAKDGVGLGSGLGELVDPPPQPASELTARMQTIHPARRGAATWGLSRAIIFPPIDLLQVTCSSERPFQDADEKSGLSIAEERERFNRKNVTKLVLRVLILAVKYRDASSRPSLPPRQVVPDRSRRNTFDTTARMAPSVILRARRCQFILALGVSMDVSETDARH